MRKLIGCMMVMVLAGACSATSDQADAGETNGDTAGITDSGAGSDAAAASDSGSGSDGAVASDSGTLDDGGTTDTGGGGTDGGTGTCGTTITITGAPTFMGTSFTHDDPVVNPKPSVVEVGTDTRVEFTERDTNPGNTKILDVTFVTATPATLKGVSMGTGTAGYSSFDLITCGLSGCAASDAGVTIDVTGRCIGFNGTVLKRYNGSSGTYDTPITLDGTIGY